MARPTISATTACPARRASAYAATAPASDWWMPSASSRRPYAWLGVSTIATMARLAGAVRSASTASRTARASDQPSSSPASPLRVRGKRLAPSGTSAIQRTAVPASSPSATSTESG
ncbi:hypothetical protein D9M69_543150 [compost metagenome]